MSPDSLVGGAGSAVRGAVRRTKAKAGSRNKGSDRDEVEGEAKKIAKATG